MYFVCPRDERVGIYELEKNRTILRFGMGVLKYQT